jgi:hypothetical protein
VEGEDEERRKAIVRRWMIVCKVSEYVHLFQSTYVLRRMG